MVFQAFQHEKYFKSFSNPGPSSGHIGTWDTQVGLLSHIKEVHTYRDWDHHFLCYCPNLIGLSQNISPLVKIDDFKVNENFVPNLKQRRVGLVTIGVTNVSKILTWLLDNLEMIVGRIESFTWPIVVSFFFLGCLSWFAFPPNRANH